MSATVASDIRKIFTQPNLCARHPVPSQRDTPLYVSALFLSPLSLYLPYDFKRAAWFTTYIHTWFVFARSLACLSLVPLMSVRYVVAMHGGDDGCLLLCLLLTRFFCCW